MGVRNPSRLYFDPLTAWEAPWNHMTYFWHHDEESAPEPPCTCVSPLHCLKRLPRTTHCAVREVPRYYCKDERKDTSHCKDIVAVKPPPWVNVPLPRPADCERRDVPSSNTINSDFGKKVCQRKTRKSREEVLVPENILKIKKTPQTLRFDPESIKKWKEDAASDELEEVFRDIRQAPSRKKSTFERDFLAQSFDICPLCRRNISAFGFCDNCIPSSLPCSSNKDHTQKVLTDIVAHSASNQNKRAAEHIHPNVDASLPMQSSQLFQEINNLFVPPTSCSCFEESQTLPSFQSFAPSHLQEVLKDTCEHCPQNCEISSSLPWSSALLPVPADIENQVGSTSFQPPFSATLDVGDVSPQDVTVVLYANRVLVAEAVNHGPNGESISAQFWALPEDVKAENLRCFLGEGKLTIVSFPLPLEFPWSLMSTLAALGPPKLVHFPCPFDP